MSPVIVEPIGFRLKGQSYTVGRSYVFTLSICFVSARKSDRKVIILMLTNFIGGLKLFLPLLLNKLGKINFWRIKILFFQSLLDDTLLNFFKVYGILTRNFSINIRIILPTSGVKFLYHLIVKRKIGQFWPLQIIFVIDFEKITKVSNPEFWSRIFCNMYRKAFRSIYFRNTPYWLESLYELNHKRLRFIDQRLTFLFL